MPHCWRSHVTAHLTFTACDGLTEIRELQGLPEPVNAATPNPGLEKVNCILKGYHSEAKNAYISVHIFWASFGHLGLIGDHVTWSRDYL